MQFQEKPTGTSKIGAGVNFTCWHAGIQRYEWRSDVGTISSNYMTYRARRTDGSYIMSDDTLRAKKFRTFETAAKALVKWATKKGAPGI